MEKEDISWLELNSCLLAEQSLPLLAARGIAAGVTFLLRLLLVTLSAVLLAFFVSSF